MESRICRKIFCVEENDRHAGGGQEENPEVPAEDH